MLQACVRQAGRAAAAPPRAPAARPYSVAIGCCWLLLHAAAALRHSFSCMLLSSMHKYYIDYNKYRSMHAVCRGA